MRTPEQFVSDMLKKKHSWSSILAVSRGTRDGRWRIRVREILVEKGLIPSDHNEELKQRDEMIDKQRSDNNKREEEGRASRHRSTPVQGYISMPGRNLLAGSTITARFLSQGDDDGPKEDKPSGGVQRSREKPGGNG